MVVGMWSTFTDETLFLPWLVGWLVGWWVGGLNLLLYCAFAQGWTPLHHAGAKGRVANMRVIIGAGGNEAEATPKGESVLDLAKDHDGAVEFLLGERGPATQNEEGSDEEDETTKIVTEEDRVAFALGLLS